MISIENGRYKRELDQEDSDENDESMNETQATTSRKSAGKRSKKSEYVLTKPIIEKYLFWFDFLIFKLNKKFKFKDLVMK